MALLAKSLVSPHRGRAGAPVALVQFLDPDELVGIRERQRPQDDRVQNAEDGGGGADAERESEHGGRREAGALAQQFQPAAEIEAEVCEPCPHCGPPVRLSARRESTTATGPRPGPDGDRGRVCEVPLREIGRVLIDLGRIGR